jgi:hypothetical protein
MIKRSNLEMVSKDGLPHHYGYKGKMLEAMDLQEYVTSLEEIIGFLQSDLEFKGFNVERKEEVISKATIHTIPTHRRAISGKAINPSRMIRQSMEKPPRHGNGSVTRAYVCLCLGAVIVVTGLFQPWPWNLIIALVGFQFITPMLCLFIKGDRR